MKTPLPSALTRRLRSFRYAFRGLVEVCRTETNAQIHLAAAVVAVALGIYFDIKRWEWVALVGSVAGVLAAEAFNSAIERLTDLVSPDYHPLAGQAKDAAAAGVLWCALGAAVVGLIVFGSRLLAL